MDRRVCEGLARSRHFYAAELFTDNCRVYRLPLANAIAGAFTGALVALLAKDMASAIASEMGKDISGAAKQALRRLRQRLRREPDTNAAMEQLEADPNDQVVQERLAEQLKDKPRSIDHQMEEPRLTIR